MYLDFSKINSAKLESPMLRLQTMGGKELGPVPFVNGLKFEINYSDLSTIEFSVPYIANGLINPLYNSLTGFKVIYTDSLGVYVITDPEKKGDGIKETKTVKGYSLEYIFQKKDLYLEEGTYNFWNPIRPQETILGRIIELNPNWTVGYVATRLIGCYRTFDAYDDNILKFCYNDAMEKYRCAIVFDVYNKTINAYDAGEQIGSLPIYLDYQNLLQEIKVEEINDDLATMLHVYGGGDLSIRDVNPINGDYIVDLSFFLNNGDLDVIAKGSTEMLSTKVRRWRADVAENQDGYTGLVSLRSSATSRKLVAEAQLTELKTDLQSLTAQQNVCIEEQALAETDSAKSIKQKELNAIYKKIVLKKKEISDKESEIEEIEAEIDGYTDSIKDIADSLSIQGYFTEDERKLLNPYLIEGSLTEETFVESDVSDDNSSVSASINGKIKVSESNISRVQLASFSRTMYMVDGGTLSISDIGLEAEIIRGTMDLKIVSGSNKYTLTTYLGKISYSGHEFDSGMITITGILSGLSSDIAAATENNITQYKGTKLSFNTSDAISYFTIASSEFQSYSVAMELYDFGSEALSDYAWPVYEFSIDSANFLYQDVFAPFKKKMELGKSIHLRLGSEGMLHPKVIGVELDFDDISKFKLTFSNRYQRKNDLEYLQDEIRNAGSTSRHFDASKYLYDRTADKMTDVSEYMNNMLDAAKQAILCAKDQSVIIDGSGIHVSSTDTDAGNDKIQLRIVNGMIAMSNDNWQTAKLAIGRFYSKEHGMDLYGVNAELIAGTLLLGSNLYIQTQDGSFSVDDTGVHVDSMKFFINNGKNLNQTLNDIDSDVSNVSKSVTSVKNDLDSVTTKDSNGISLNATDLKGVISAQQAQMRSGGGNVLFDSDGIWLMNATAKNLATKAVWMNENGILFGSGSKTSDPGSASSGWSWTTAIGHNGITAEALYGKTLNAVQINGGSITIGKSSSSDNNYLYVDSGGNLFIGKKSDDKGYNFAVTSEGRMFAQSGQFAGELVAASGTFTGTLKAADGTFTGSLSAVDGTFTGTLRAANIEGALTADSSKGGEIVGCAIYVPNKTNPKFKVDSNGNVTMAGNIYMGDGSIKFSDLPSILQNTISDARQASADIANGKYSGGTFISGKEIYSPTIYADEFVVRPQTTASSGSWSGGYKMLGYYESTLYEMLQINYEISDITPTVKFGSPCSAYANWNFRRTYFNGYLNFSNATIEGLDLTARFG